MRTAGAVTGGVVAGVVLTVGTFLAVIRWEDSRADRARAALYAAYRRR